MLSAISSSEPSRGYDGVYVTWDIDRDQDEQLVDERETLRRADADRHVRKLQQRQQLRHERGERGREDGLLRLQRHQQHPAGRGLRQQGEGATSQRRQRGTWASGW